METMYYLRPSLYISNRLSHSGRFFIPTFYVQNYLRPESVQRQLPIPINKQPHNEKAAELLQRHSQP
jgi:hypothetical protein